MPSNAIDLGKCDNPNDSEKLMLIKMNDYTLTGFEIAIHEALHACFFDMDEDAVERAGQDISRFLWRLGYRRTKNKKGVRR
jgi:hypothetical protein